MQPWSSQGAPCSLGAGPGPGSCKIPLGRSWTFCDHPPVRSPVNTRNPGRSCCAETALQMPQWRNKEPIPCKEPVNHPHPEPTLPQGMFPVCLPNWGNHQRVGSGPTESTMKWISIKTYSPGVSRVAQWLRIHLPMQGTRV